MKSTSQSDAFELPKLGIRLLELILPPAGAENELGDLEEEYYAKVLEEGSEYARRWFWRQTFMTVWVSIVEGGAGHLLLVKAVSWLQSHIRGLAVLLAGTWIPRRCAVGLVSFPLVAFSLIALYTPGPQRIQVTEGQLVHPPNTSDVLSPNKSDTVTDGGVSRRFRADDQPVMLVETYPVKGVDSGGGRQSRRPSQITVTETEDVQAPGNITSSNPESNHVADPRVSRYQKQVDALQTLVAVPGDDRSIVNNPPAIASEAHSEAGSNSSGQQPPPPTSTSVAQTTQPGGSPKLETDLSAVPEAESTPDDNDLPGFAAPRLSQVNHKILTAIEERIGVPYRLDTKRPYRSDSSDFVWSVFQQAGVNFERGSARDLWSQFQPVDGSDRYEFGTLVFFSNLHHVGIVVDENGFYHASTSRGVVYSRFDDYWTKRINGFRTIPPSTQASLGMFNLAAE
jgi:cell wall-associated NlpC family hydrolase